jgi:hypothetical protein
MRPSKGGLCCSAQQHGTPLGHLLAAGQGSCLTKVLAPNGPLRLVLSGPLNLLVPRDLREMRFALHSLFLSVSLIGDVRFIALPGFWASLIGDVSGPGSKNASGRFSLRYDSVALRLLSEKTDIL